MVPNVFPTEKEQSRNCNSENLLGPALVFDAVSVAAWPFIFASGAFDGALCCCCVGRLSLLLSLSSL
jgi:hypothetical protein